jgi:K+-sensing histidine kinase KdpD
LSDAKPWRSGAVGYFAGAGIFLILLIVLLPLRNHVNSATIALVFLIGVLLTAAAYGSFPALAVSVLSLLAFNYFFTHPYHTFMVADPQNWVALIAFLVTALTAGGLSAKEKRRAEEAQRLYHQLQQAFEKASEAEGLKQSERLKSALIDAVTHDLRTPLTSMKAAVTAVLSRSAELKLDEEGKRELLEVVDAEIDRMNRLVEELIQMARIEAGSMQPQKRLANVEEIISNVLSRASGITSDHVVRADVQGNIPLIFVDEKIIAEILYILIENASKFSPRDTEILVRAAMNRDSIHMSVQDQGSGIPADLREKVFEKFFRASTSNVNLAQRPPGMGMGLAIARALVEAHGGTIRIEEPHGGIGGKVAFSIPVEAQTTVIV